MLNKFKLIQKIMKDENLRKFCMHPKVQKLFLDSEFQAAVKTGDTQKISAHPKLLELAKDEELKELMKKVNFTDLM